MFVYTFENIGNIKNLKHSDSIKPKHQKKIDKVKDGLFAKFDYSDFELAPEGWKPNKFIEPL